MKRRTKFFEIIHKKSVFFEQFLGIGICRVTEMPRDFGLSWIFLGGWFRVSGISHGKLSKNSFSWEFNWTFPRIQRFQTPPHHPPKNINLLHQHISNSIFSQKKKNNRKNFLHLKKTQKKKESVTLLFETIKNETLNFI